MMQDFYDRNEYLLGELIAVAEEGNFTQAGRERC